MNDLTEKNEKTLRFISEYQEENGFSPSLDDIKKAIGTRSTRGATLQLEKLQLLGYIRREPNARRAIKVLLKPASESKETIIVPIVGEVKAGYGRIADQNIDESREIPLALTGGRRNVFLLRVDGDSMSQADIFPGNLVIVTPQSTANNGDIVIAIDEGTNEGTIKRYKKLKNYIVLLPESDNPEHQPKIGRNFLIQGKVIGKLTN